MKLSANITKLNIETIFKAYYEPLCKYANSFIFDRDLCEDLVQEVFLKIWDKSPDINSSISSYLYRAVKNSCLNQLKQTAKQVIIPIEKVEDPIDTPYEINREENLDLVKRKVESAIENLPPRCREIFIMRRNMQMSYDEIADALNISKKTIENQMNSAIKKLRSKLSKSDLLIYFLMIGKNIK